MVEIRFLEYDLQNGLHVIMSPNDSPPVVAVDMWYHVGSKDENPNRTGFAHLFEHMMFQGSAHVAKAEHMKYVEQAGGASNASTTWDRTSYFEVLPSHQLELALWLESDRMMSLDISQEKLDNQRDVVKEERRWRVDNRPYGTAWEKIFKLAYRIHPYRWPVVGYMEHLDAASVEDFRSFFRSYYSPNNAVLAISGDFDTGRTRNKVEKYFADIPCGQEIIRHREEEPPLSGRIRETVYDNVSLPAVYMAFRIPPVTSDDYEALSLAACILTDGKSSRLYANAVYRKYMAQSVDAFSVDMEDPGIFVVSAVVSSRHKPEDVESEIESQLGELSRRPPHERELLKAKNQTISRWVKRLGRAMRRADSLARFYTVFGSTEGINHYSERILSITGEQVSAVTRRYLSPSNCVVVNYLPASESREG